MFDKIKVKLGKLTDLNMQYLADVESHILYLKKGQWNVATVQPMIWEVTQMIEQGDTAKHYENMVNFINKRVAPTDPKFAKAMIRQAKLHVLDCNPTATVEERYYEE